MFEKVDWATHPEKKKQLSLPLYGVNLVFTKWLMSGSLEVAGLPVHV